MVGAFPTAGHGVQSAPVAGASPHLAQPSQAPLCFAVNFPLPFSAGQGRAQESCTRWGEAPAVGASCTPCPAVGEGTWHGSPKPRSALLHREGEGEISTLLSRAAAEQSKAGLRRACSGLGEASSPHLAVGEVTQQWGDLPPLPSQPHPTHPTSSQLSKASAGVI